MNEEKKRGKKLSLINCTKSEKEMGITLIALIITVVILIILVAISLNAVFGSDGIIESARKSEIMNNFSTFKEQINTFNAEKELESEDYSVESLTAGRTTLIYNTQGEDTTGNIQTVIPSMNDDYAEKFEIIKGELLLYASSQQEYDIAVGMGIKVSPYIIVDGVLLSANQNLALQTTDGVVTLPERVTEIGQGAFSGVEGLKEIIIPGTVKVIQADAFSYNAEIEKVTIMDGVESIGDYAFYGCEKIKEIDMPDSIVSIGHDAFRECINLSSIKLSDNVKEIKTQTFYGTENLKEIELPSNLEYIGGNVFAYSGITNINIPETVMFIEASALSDCDYLYNVTVDENNKYLKIENDILYTNNESNKYGLENYLILALAKNKNKTTITIPEGIKYIDKESLNWCYNAQTINLPSTLEYIEGGCVDTDNLQNFNVPVGNEYYKSENGYLYSQDGKQLVWVSPTKSVVEINESVESIATQAIRNLSHLTELIIPDNVTTIDYRAFDRLYNLKKIKIGKGVNNLDSSFKIYISSNPSIEIDNENPYYKVDGNLILTKNGKEVVTIVDFYDTQIVVPDGVEKIGEYAFRNSLANTIILPNTLKEIGKAAFYSLDNITEIEIPSSVETIGNGAFNKCGNLAEIRINKTRGSISGSPWGVPKGERAIIWLR